MKENNLTTLGNQFLRNRYARLLAGIFTLVIIVILVNWFFVQRTLSTVIASDKRNRGLEINAHYDYWLNFNSIVFDLREVDENKNSSIDIIRTLIQFSEAMQYRNFERIYLANRGNKKFFIRGEYFKKLGQEYDHQNPIYTIRTFPENIYNIDGTQAYSAHKGGMLFVLNEQMQDFSDLVKKWFIIDLINKNKKISYGLDNKTDSKEEDILKRFGTISNNDNSGLDGLTKEDDWQYYEKTDPINDLKSHYIALKSKNTDSRHNEESTLIISCAGSQYLLHIHWDSYLGSDNNIKVITRIDQESAVEEYWALSREVTTYNHNFKAFFEWLLKHKQLIARVNRYNDTSITATFDITGLSEAFEPLRKACNYDML